MRAAEVSSPLAWDANGGDVAVQVVSAEAFNPGVEVSIFDTTQRGWYASHAVIRGIDDNILYLDQPINMNRLCLRGRGGTVAHAFPAFVAWEVHDCGLQSLSIDGGEGMNQSVFADFTILLSILCGQLMLVFGIVLSAVGLRTGLVCREDQGL